MIAPPMAFGVECRQTKHSWTQLIQKLLICGTGRFFRYRVSVLGPGAYCANRDLSLFVLSPYRQTQDNASNKVITFPFRSFPVHCLHWFCVNCVTEKASLHNKYSGSSTCCKDWDVMFCSKQFKYHILLPNCWISGYKIKDIICPLFWNTIFLFHEWLETTSEKNVWA
jgi:hypothetical protein